MPRCSRENSIDDKRRMRNKRNKRKRLSRAAKEREAKEIQQQREIETYSRAKHPARVYYTRWKELADQSKRRTQDRTKVGLFYRKVEEIRFYRREIV